jgi:diketogulonate reductase-like aldo/keto reductase
MTYTTEVPAVTLHDGVEIPQLGFGVFQVPPAETQQAVEEALAVGYRHIDTAAAYRNEAGVAAAIAASGIAREEVFVTTKLWNSEQGYDSTLAACERSLEALGSDHFDLYLIHWPVPTEGRTLETWHAFERIKAEGKSRSIGVSNFRVEDLERLRSEAEELPTVNQVELHPCLQQAELHPCLQQAELRAWHVEHAIATEAWSPLAQGAVLDDETIVTIAAHHERTPAQVVLRWHLQIGNVVIPKSVTPARVRENFEVFDFELAEDEIAAIAGLDRGERIGPDPGSFVAP